MEPLTDNEIRQALDELEGWSHEDDKLNREFKFKNFREAMAFITRIAFEAEEQVHHPELFNVYNTVRISLSTHDAGGKVTRKDVKLAKTIDTLYKG